MAASREAFQEDRISKKDLLHPDRLQLMRSLSLLALALLLCSSGAFCQTNGTIPGDLNASTLRSLVVDSSAKLESYSFSMEMVQNIDLINLSSGEAQKLYTRSIGFGFTNMTDRALKLVMASLTYEKGDEENSTAVALEEYLLNDTIYIKMDGNWTIMKLPAAAAWSQQNTMEQQVNMFKQSDLTLIGSEIVDGQDCYKVRAKMDMGTYAGRDTTSYLPMASTNNTDLFRNLTLNVYYWITKDTHLLKKTDVLEVFTLDPQSLGLPATGPESQEMRIDSTVSMLFGGFNERVNIVLPPEARKAQPSPAGSVAFDEAVPVASVESEGLSEPTSRIDESKSRLNESMSKLNEPMPDPAKLDELKLRLNESMPDPAKLDELKSRLNESMPDPAKLDELKSRLNESMPDPAKLDELKSRLNKALANATRLNETLANATRLNETLANATRLNETMVNATRLNETMVNATRLNETLANATRLNETMVNATRLNETMVNATRLNETLANAAMLNETNTSARKLNDSMQENKMTQATSTAWRIFF